MIVVSRYVATFPEEEPRGDVMDTIERPEEVLEEVQRRF
jgi:hypothetical protein